MERRSYNQFCGLAHSLDIVGERWTLLVVRNLLLGPLRYSELLRGLPGITTNLLAKRLKEMEELELIERVRMNGADAYRLAPSGAALEPAIHALGRWGWQWMDQPKRGEIRNVEWLFVALRRRYLGGTTLKVEIVADDSPYRLILAGDSVEISRGEAPSPDLRVRGAGMSVAKMFLEGRAPSDLEVEGGAANLRELLGAFSRSELRNQ
jgi:DNA-binding HxlR family transcriptional regulator